MSKEDQKTFNAIARRAVANLPELPYGMGAEPWQRWLDFMRRAKWGFRVTKTIRCSELEWELGVKDGKPLA